VAEEAKDQLRKQRVVSTEVNKLVHAGVIPEINHLDWLASKK